ncbi:ATP-binding protein [Bradyrhizobium sp. SZCCHNPS2010]|uniref:ATP-binding protein n=1 Tax=Bradyrhizobium sp. SZCCHNPS2010 TaxID=3057333 RepID=UPI002916FFD5|nr:winged helix-turn-helix domain-containing protein [Bradyrhizobium sp. SZCCHNPS2010]
MDGDIWHAGETISFGPFRLIAAERLLLNDDQPVILGGRALDVLIALTERAGEVVSRQELINRVWPGVTVEKANLRVHIANLRKALGDGRDGARYITNVPGRGYCFVATIQRGASPAASAVSGSLKNTPKVPARLPRMVGRDETVATLSKQLTSLRFLSIVGPGGIGKTTVAVAMAHALLDEFDGAIFFFDLSMIIDAALVVTTIASALGCLTPALDPLPGLLASVADRKLLLVFDSCEHLIQIVAVLTERLFSEAPSVHLLTTTREALRVEGETVHLLSPLHGPRDKIHVTASEALASPAVQLFMERASASGYRTELTDADAPIVAKICERLDGIALAIELAASRVGAYGIRGIAELLDGRLTLLWQGRRNVPRHQTMQSTLDWSYNLLSEPEKRVLGRLSVFVGSFTLQAAQTVADEPDREPLHVAKTIAGLVDKSLVSISANRKQNYFRLMDTTRAYAALKLQESGEAETIARRHALYYAEYLEIGASGATVFPDLSASSVEVGNIRAALEWSFSRLGDATIGVAIAARAAPTILRFSLLDECRRWCQRALAVLDDNDRGTKRELALREALAISSHYRESSETTAALDRGLALAEALEDHESQLRMLSGLNVFRTKLADFDGALAAAQRFAAIAVRSGNPAKIRGAEWMLGAAHHLLGNQPIAQSHYEKGFDAAPSSDPLQVGYFGHDQRSRALAGLARTLWLRGLPERAFGLAHEAIEIVEKGKQPLALCVCLLYVIPIFLRSGDFANAEKMIERLIVVGEKYSLEAYHTDGIALKGELMIARGETDKGVVLIRQALPTLHTVEHNVLVILANRALAEGLLRSGQVQEALKAIDIAIEQSGRNGPTYDTPDLLQTRGEILLALPDADAAEQALVQSLELAKIQDAVAWQLRSAISLARLWEHRGRAAEASNLLIEISQRFAEGSDTAELREATRLIGRLRAEALPL